MPPRKEKNDKVAQLSSRAHHASGKNVGGRPKKKGDSIVHHKLHGQTRQHHFDYEPDQSSYQKRDYDYQWRADYQDSYH